MRKIALPCSPFCACFLLNALIFAAEAFNPTPALWNSHSRVSTPAVVCAMTETNDHQDAAEKTSMDVMNWFLREPESPIFMAMVNKLSREMWDPIKHQLDACPVFYCGAEGIQPTDLPFPCFMDLDDAKAHLKLLGDKGAEKEKEKKDTLPMLLGDAYENAALGHSKIRASAKNRRMAAELSHMENLGVDEAFVPVFGIKTLVKSQSETITGLTDRVYFDGAQAQGILEQVNELYESEDESFELFAVSLTKAIEYMILDKDSGFKFEFIPPASSLEHLTSKHNTF